MKRKWSRCGGRKRRKKGREEGGREGLDSLRSLVRNLGSAPGFNAMLEWIPPAWLRNNYM